MRVLITHPIPGRGIPTLEGHGFEVTVLHEATRKTLLRTLKRTPYDGLITLLTDQVDAEVFDHAPQLKIVANYAVGFGNIDLAVARERGIVVTNTPDVLTDTVAEHTVALILAVAKRIVTSDAFTRAGRFKGWRPDLFLGKDLKGKRLGIIGAGRIGARVAALCHVGFGMDILYYDLHRNPTLEKAMRASYADSPDAVLRSAHVVSLHVPLNEHTRHFLHERRLRLMRSDAILVNASRGAVIDEEALIRILREQVIFGAGLDVFEHEPEIPRALRRLENVVLTPHTASASVRTRENMSLMVAENVSAVLQGGKPLHPVQ